jgi:hypothetical protein
MNEKKLKKITKRIKAKKRAQSQTARRRTRLTARKEKGKMAPDIYRAKKGATIKREDGGYTIKRYNYNEFEYGDPLKADAKPPIAFKGSAKDKARKNIFTIVD